MTDDEYSYMHLLVQLRSVESLLSDVMTPPSVPSGVLEDIKAARQLLRTAVVELEKGVRLVRNDGPTDGPWIIGPPPSDTNKEQLSLPRPEPIIRR